jgi:hypothetical protein
LQYQREREEREKKAEEEARLLFLKDAYEGEIPQSKQKTDTGIPREKTYEQPLAPLPEKERSERAQREEQERKAAIGRLYSGTKHYIAC